MSNTVNAIANTTAEIGRAQNTISYYALVFIGIVTIFVGFGTLYYNYLKAKDHEDDKEVNWMIPIGCIIGGPLAIVFAVWWYNFVAGSKGMQELEGAMAMANVIESV
jgi:4-amino-4-deoxy-L-arabinose transferase-like glycosyltransferase